MSDFSVLVFNMPGFFCGSLNYIIVIVFLAPMFLVIPITPIWWYCQRYYLTRIVGLCSATELSGLTFIMFFVHDIARTAEIHTKTTQMRPKKASGVPNSTLRTRPSLYNNNNNNNNNHNKNPRIHPQNSNLPKHYKKPCVHWTPLRL